VLTSPARLLHERRDLPDHDAGQHDELDDDVQFAEPGPERRPDMLHAQVVAVVVAAPNAARHVSDIAVTALMMGNRPA